MKAKKLGFYLIIAGVLGLGLIVLLLSRFDIDVEVESLPSPEASTSPLPPLALDRSSRPKPSPTQSPRLEATPQATPTSRQFRRGSLRVSNQTEHPIRVVLLYKRFRGNQPATAIPPADVEPLYGEPVHWDFAPNEGSTKGLILSLPNSQLTLQTGDVLIAFVQDGSRRYWGPYVVGETEAPVWDADTNEWQLILQPDL